MSTRRQDDEDLTPKEVVLGVFALFGVFVVALLLFLLLLTIVIAVGNAWWEFMQEFILMVTL